MKGLLQSVFHGRVKGNGGGDPSFFGVMVLTGDCLVA